jgi:hypothetical protein
MLTRISLKFTVPTPITTRSLGSYSFTSLGNQRGFGPVRNLNLYFVRNKNKELVSVKESKRSFSSWSTHRYLNRTPVTNNRSYLWIPIPNSRYRSYTSWSTQDPRIESYSLVSVIGSTIILILLIIFYFYCVFIGLIELWNYLDRNISSTNRGIKIVIFILIVPVYLVSITVILLGLTLATSLLTEGFFLNLI